MIVEITAEERNLILDIRSLGYGQITNHEILDSGGRPTKFEVDEQEYRLLKLIHDGYRFFSLIQVYQKKPDYADVPIQGKHSGAKETKRFKLK